MSDNEQPHPKKKVTAPTTDAPQEEFISQENVPSKSETELERKRERAPEKKSPP
jgi:hypothetical protein